MSKASRVQRDPSEKLVYHWDEITPENSSLFGQKCARLALAKQADLPVPPFFAISLDGVRQIIHHRGIPALLQEQIRECLTCLEEGTGRSYTDVSNPLITAVRSGDPFSMAGAMFSYLNVGINEATIPALIARFKNTVPFLQMYLDSIVDHAFMVEHQPKERFADILDAIRSRDHEAEDLRRLINRALSMTPTFPQNTIAQIDDAIIAVALSWHNVATSAFREEMEIGEDVFPSIIVQEMAFGSLNCSAFLAFCTHNPVNGKNALHGDFALGTEGRLMMRGIGPERFLIDTLPEHFPEIAKEIDALVPNIVRLFRKPQDIEAIIQLRELKIVQISDAHLAPAARRTITAELQAQGVLKMGESIPPVPGMQRTRVIKTYKLRPDIELELIAEGVPTHPGAVEGRLALSVQDAIRLGLRHGNRTILLLQEPDERVLPRLLKRQIEGFAAAYASTHDYAAAMLSHVPSVMSMGVRTEGYNYLIAPNGNRIPAGKRVILDGTTGRLYLAPPMADVALLEDNPILATPHELSGYQIERETRERFGHMPYEGLLREHARYVKKIRDFKGETNVSTMPKEETIEYAKMELITHYIHLMIFDQGAARGMAYFDVQLDVAIHDGSLDRVPGLEHKKIALERDGKGITLILGTEINYEYEVIKSHALSPEEVSRLVARLQEAEIPHKLYKKQTKLSMHTQYVTTTALSFEAPLLDKVIHELRAIDAAG